MDIILIVIFILMPAIILHEYAHGWMAYKLGDPTAKLAGRLTLNPIKHIDPVGTLILPGALIAMRMMGVNVFVFGWAKPVPVNFLKLNNPKRDMIWVAFAGPAVNFIMAWLASFMIKGNGFSPMVQTMLGYAVFINLLLAIFNLIPIPPLDGSRILMGFLPKFMAAQYARLERYGIFIVMVLLYFGAFEWIVFPLVETLGRYLGIQL